MIYPLHVIPKSQRPKYFWPLLLLTLLVMAILELVNSPLITTAAPQGIVSFELAGTPAGTENILASWDPNAQVHAGFSLGLDYLFMILYAATISLACLWAMDILHERDWPLAKAGSWIAWGIWLAAILDAIENIALVMIFFGSQSPFLPLVARACAVSKFGLIFIGLVFVLYGLAVRAVIRPQPNQ